MSEQTAENKMGVKPEGRLLFGMSLPMMISMLVQALYNIVDSIFVSKIDQDALTAVSLAFPMQLLMVAIGAGTGVGVNALISRSLGEKRQDRANAVAANGIFVYILSYLAILVIALLFVRPFYAMQTNEEQRAIMEYGVKYLSIVMIFSFGIFAQFLFERMLQATGRTLFTMFSQGIGAIINLIFDPLLIFGIGPFPEMGISGAAIATVMGQIIAGCIALWGNIALNKDIHISLKGFKPEGEIIKSIYKIG
ncbi:MAG: polysaccharide biosynthesis C-terminal domain-containing protein, partial [Lachnospiraceae bacterium]|nr:polysaccharide biosynthesis C-terminal domain-containing protein [Lachnospiraceae bacterium]